MININTCIHIWRKRVWLGWYGPFFGPPWPEDVDWKTNVCEKCAEKILTRTNESTTISNPRT